MKNVRLSKKVKKGRRGGGGWEVKPTIIFSHRRKTFQYEIYMWKIFDHNHCFEDAQILPQWGHKSDMFTKAEIVKHVENIFLKPLS